MISLYVRMSAMSRLAMVRLSGVTALLLGAVVGGTAGTATATTLRSGCSRPSTAASLEGWGSSQTKQITSRIGFDQRVLAREGVQLTQWGPDACSGKVKVYLTHFSLAAARVLVA